MLFLPIYFPCPGSPGWGPKFEGKKYKMVPAWAVFLNSEGRGVGHTNTRTNFRFYFIALSNCCHFLVDDKNLSFFYNFALLSCQPGLEAFPAELQAAPGQSGKARGSSLCTLWGGSHPAHKKKRIKGKKSSPGWMDGSSLLRVCAPENTFHHPRSIGECYIRRSPSSPFDTTRSSVLPPVADF